MTSFSKKVIAVVAKIKEGQTLTYKEVAKRAGSPNAYRAVGTIMRTYDSSKIKIPCHRVVRSDGKPGEYRWGAMKKRKMLAKEFARL
jgi:O-6-methylguanine DNA methyltransferase